MTFRCVRLEVAIVFHAKVLIPCMCPGIEKCGEPSVRGVKRSEIGAFEAVAEDTGQCQVFGGCCAAMLLGDNVVDLKG